jgi:hypothetical protein
MRKSPGLTRRTLLKGAIAAGAVAAIGPGSRGAYAATMPFLSYSPGSFFKSRVIGAPVDAARTAEFRSFMKSYPDQIATPYPKINGLGTNKWGTGYAEGSATDPIWKLTGTVQAKVADLKTTGFHAPEWLGQTFSGSNDSPFCVIDRGSGFTVFASNAQVVGPHLVTVSSAGKVWHSSNGLHYKNPRTDDSRNFTARGRISDAMVIRRDLVEYGIATGTSLGHVLHIFLCETDSNDGFCHPMVGCESRHIGGFGAEGERIAIDASVDLSTRGLPPAGLVVARTLQEYGCYIGDNSGNASALKAEQTTASRNPWTGIDINQASLRGITWDDFVVLPKGWQ